MEQKDCCHHDADDEAPASSESVPTSKYVCPMHPEVVSDEPGDCSKCGMSLEPARPPALAAGATVYTCPMHPEIERDQPGDCPKCGMPLEPKTVSTDTSAEDAEMASLRMKFIIGLILTLPVLLLAMGAMIPSLPMEKWIPKNISKWIEFTLATPVVFWAGGIFFVKAWRSVVNRSLNMFTLIAMGVGAAWLYSAVAVLFPGLFPDSFKRNGEV